MFNWLKNLLAGFKKTRKEGELGSLEETEQLLHSSIYQAAEPTPEFSDQLKRRLHEARAKIQKSEAPRANQSSSMDTSSRFSFRFKTWIPVAALAVLILLAVPLLLPFLGREEFLLIDRAYAADAFRVVATEADPSGVESQTSFKITAKQPVKEGELRDHLKLEPESDFKLKKLSDTEFEVTPQDPLEGGKVYNLVIDAAYKTEKGIITPKEFRFAFQVKDTFKVLKTLPGDKKNEIPGSSGIEVTFSHATVNLEDFEKHFSITPNVSGKFEKHSRTLVFVPKGGLKYETLYTVKIAAGLPLPQTEQKLEKDYTFQFFTQKEPRGYKEAYLSFDYRGNWLSFKPGEKPKFTTYTSGIFPMETPLRVYRISSLEDLEKRLNLNSNIPGWVCYSCLSREVETEGLPQALTTTVGDVLTDENNQSHITLPAFDEPGIYVVEVKGEDISASQYVFQVTNLKSFVMNTETKSFLWVHNAESKKPVSGAAVSSFRSDINVKTDEKGVAIFETPKCDTSRTSPDSDFFVAKAGTESVVVPVHQGCKATPDYQADPYLALTASSNYAITLTTDRPLYLPTDTIHFWGVAKRRRDHRPEKIAVELRGGWGSGEKVASLETQTSPLGTYQGSFSIKNLPPDYYYLVAKTEKGEGLGTASVEIATFQKPLYNFEVRVDKDAVIVGDTVTAKAKVTFFDGTPVNDLELQYENNLTGKGTVKTNMAGEATVTIDTGKLSSPTGDDWFDNMVWQFVDFEPVKPEYGLSKGHANFVVFRTDRDLRLERRANATIGGKLEGIDVSKFDAKAWGPSRPSYFTGGIANQSLEITINRIFSEKKETGETYDPISKQSIKLYEYARKEETVKTLSLKTGADGSFTVDFPFDKKTEYRIHATVKDSKGRENKASTYFYPLYSSGSNVETDLKTVMLVDLAEKRYNLGEKVQLQIKVNDEPLNEESEFIYFEAQSGLLKVVPSSTPTYEFTFKDQHVPNVHVGVVWFDGTFYRNTWSGGGGADVFFNTDVKKLNIEVSPDKESYRPRDKAVITIATKNASGQAVAAEVNVKLVDEAIYKLRDANEDPLKSLYEYVWQGILGVASTAPSDSGGGGMGGGGGDEQIRRVFKNTPLFETIQTGGDGKAQVSVTLPDDLTTFRVTAQGVTEDLQAGIATGKVVTSLPFFVDVTANDVYLAGDKPQIRLRSFGTELPRDTGVKYTISIPSLAEGKKEVSGKAGQDFWYALPALKAGEHTVTVQASAGNLKDGLEKKFRVVDSLVTVPVVKTIPLKEGTALADISVPRAKVVFSLSPYSEYYDALHQLLWSSHNRLDSRLASKISGALLDEYYGEKNANREENFAAYQNPSGGMQLLPYDDADLDLSFRAAVFADESFNADSLEMYFDSILESRKSGSNREEIAMALAGKAALGRPVLNDLKLFLEISRKDLTPREKLVVAFGLATLGDSGVANELFNEVSTGHMKREGEALILQLSENQEENDELNSLALAVAATASHVEGPALWKAVRDFKPTHTLTSLEQVIALQAFLKRAPAVQEGSLRYTIDSRTEKVNLKKAETSGIFLSGDDLKKINFSDLKGSVAATVYYDLPLAKSSQKFSDTLKVTRTYTVYGNQTTNFNEGDIVTITIRPEVKTGEKFEAFAVIDTLPAGLLPLAQVHYDWYYDARGGLMGDGNERVSLSYPDWVEGQRVSFRFMKGSREISYKARVVSKGQFTAEPVVLQQMDNPTRMNISGAATVEIK